MSEDLEHHLEGSLVRPGEVSVYLYDSRSQPVPTQDVSGAAATLHEGQGTETAGIAAEVKSGYLSFPVGEVRFPCTFNLLIHFADWPQAAPPELFTFVFDDFAEAP